MDIPGQREPSPDTLLLERLREMSDRCATRSVVDPRSDDDLVGYDQHGLPNQNSHPLTHCRWSPTRPIL